MLRLEGEQGYDQQKGAMAYPRNKAEKKSKTTRKGNKAAVSTESHSHSNNN